MLWDSQTFRQRNILFWNRISARGIENSEPCDMIVRLSVGKLRTKWLTWVIISNPKWIENNCELSNCFLATESIHTYACYAVAWPRVCVCELSRNVKLFSPAVSLLPSFALSFTLCLRSTSRFLPVVLKFYSLRECMCVCVFDVGFSVHFVCSPNWLCAILFFSLCSSPLRSALLFASFCRSFECIARWAVTLSPRVSTHLSIYRCALMLLVCVCVCRCGRVCYFKYQFVWYVYVLSCYWSPSNNLLYFILFLNIARAYTHLLLIQPNQPTNTHR